MTKYYEIHAKNIDSEIETLFGSFDKEDCIDEKDAEKDNWKAEGYKAIKIVTTETNEYPDPEVYTNEDSYTKVVAKALKDPSVRISVGDTSEDHYDLEQSRNLVSIIEACEATESPLIDFYRDKDWKGSLLISVGSEEDSIIDYHCNTFMNNLINSI